MHIGHDHSMGGDHSHSHTHAHTHECLSRACAVGACRLEATSHSALNVTLSDTCIREHCALVAHIDKLLGLVIVGYACDTYRLHLKSASLAPALVELGCHKL